MNLPVIILAILGIIAAGGTATAYFARSRGVGTIKLLQVNIDAYKDSEKLKDAKILYLQGQVDTKDEIINGLVKQIKDGKRQTR